MQLGQDHWTGVMLADREGYVGHVQAMSGGLYRISDAYFLSAGKGAAPLVESVVSQPGQPDRNLYVPAGQVLWFETFSNSSPLVQTIHKIESQAKG